MSRCDGLPAFGPLPDTSALAHSDAIRIRKHTSESFMSVRAGDRWRHRECLPTPDAIFWR